MSFRFKEVMNTLRSSVKLVWKFLFQLHCLFRFSFYSDLILNKKAVLSQENRAMPQLFFSV